MRLFKTIAGLRSHLELSRWEQRGGAVARRQVGLVPTMGALHAGHLSLIQRARQENHLVVVTIFVNPLQFGPSEDFQKYPKTLEQDCHICEAAGADVVFAPSAEALYGTPQFTDSEALTRVVPPAPMLAVLCGPFRPGHFTGVATVVLKLLHLVQPDRAYFGQKDAQQLAILQRAVADLNLWVELVPCPTVREPDGLALSSRNQYLSPTERSHATILYRGLRQAEALFQQGTRSCRALIAAVQAELDSVPSVQPDYIDLVHPLTMMPLEQIDDAGLLAIAARIGSTRLIDNLVLRARKPIVAIDGPAGAGKSTVARQVAQTLGLLYLDTGAMYRAVTWLVLQSGVPLADEAAIAELVSQCNIDLRDQERSDAGQPCTVQTVWIDGQEVTDMIRTPEVTAQVSAIAAQAAVRHELVKQQQDYGRRGGVVMDGRDIGTHVFPDAELKIFLTASVQERARRRQQDLKQRGQGEIRLEDLEQAIFERDQKDSTRAIAPLRRAADAIEISTDDLTIADVTSKIIRLYHEKLEAIATR